MQGGASLARNAPPAMPEGTNALAKEPPRDSTATPDRKARQMHDTIDETTLAYGTTILPDIDDIPPAPDAPEHVRARWWRIHSVKMTRAEVAELTGVSASRIADIEAGENRSTKQPIDDATMKRYRMACAAVTLGADFDFVTLSVIPTVPVEIRLFRGSK